MDGMRRCNDFLIRTNDMQKSSLGGGQINKPFEIIFYLRIRVEADVMVTSHTAIETR